MAGQMGGIEIFTGGGSDRGTNRNPIRCHVHSLVESTCGGVFVRRAADLEPNLAPTQYNLGLVAHRASQVPPTFFFITLELRVK